MEQYPATIPLPALRDGAYRQQSNIEVDEMGGGNIKTRLVGHGNPPTIKECTWRLRRADAALFEGWLEHVLGKALAPFEMVVTSPAGRVPHVCKLLSDPRSDRTPLSLIFWEYRATVLITRMETLPAADVRGVLSMSDLVARVRAALANYVR